MLELILGNEKEEEDLCDNLCTLNGGVEMIIPVCAEPGHQSDNYSILKSEDVMAWDS